MRARGWGRVIQVSSVLGDLPKARQPHYAAANAARNNLAASLARELKDSGVTSNAVAAGSILTPARKDAVSGIGKQNGWGESFAEIEPKYRDYADAGAFLASPVTGYITCATLRIDGGWYD